MSDAALSALALQAQADTFADGRAAAERVEEFQAQAGSPPPAQLSPEEQAAAESKAQAAALEQTFNVILPKLCNIAWGAIDTAAVKYAGAEFKLTPEERSTLADQTAPVVLKHLPKDWSWLVNTPEGALLVTAAVIYGAKFMAGEKSPAPAAAVVPPSPATAAVVPSPPQTGAVQ